jgi:hypothetical protein
MKLLFVFLATAICATVVASETEKVDGKDHSCAELQKMVREKGRLYIKGRWLAGAVYVSSASYCRNQATPSSTPSADKSRCRVGYACVSQPNNK